MKKTILTVISSIFILCAVAQDKCKGTTSAGQCKAVVGIKAGYCYRHQPDAKHCPYKAENGKQCGNVTKDGNFCRFHKN